MVAVRTALALLALTGLLAVAAPVGAQAQGQGWVGVSVSPTVVEFEPRQSQLVEAHVSALINCPLVTAPADLVVRVEPHRLVEWDEEQTRVVWQMQRAQWAFKWRSGSWPGHYYVDETVFLDVRSRDAPAQDTVQRVEWRADHWTSNPTRCGVGYGWRLVGQPALEIRAFAEADSRRSAGASHAPLGLRGEPPEGFRPIDETPPQARFALAGALAAAAALAWGAVNTLRTGRGD